jgi:hypothetical protein
MSNRQTRAVKDRRNAVISRDDGFVRILQALQAVTDDKRRGLLEEALLEELGIEGSKK